MTVQTIRTHLKYRIEELQREKEEMEELGAPDEESYLKTDARYDELCHLRDMIDNTLKTEVKPWEERGF
jgi:hypothetical protein